MKSDNAFTLHPESSKILFTLLLQSEVASPVWEKIYFARGVSNEFTLNLQSGKIFTLQWSLRMHLPCIPYPGIHLPCNWSLSIQLACIPSLGKIFILNSASGKIFTSELDYKYSSSGNILPWNWRQRIHWSCIPSLGKILPFNWSLRMHLPCIPSLGKYLPWNWRAEDTFTLHFEPVSTFTLQLILQSEYFTLQPKCEYFTFRPT
jgi:hypothetical protein